MNAKLESNIKQAIEALAWFRDLAPYEHANGVDAERYSGFSEAPFYAPLLKATRGETVIEDGEFMEGPTLPEQMIRGLLHSQKVALAGETRLLLESFLAKLDAWRNEISERVEEYRWKTCDIRNFTADSDMRTVLGHEHQETLEGMRVEAQRIIRLLRVVLSVLEPEPNSDYPSPKNLARDRYIWENILSMSSEQLQLEANNEKKFPGTRPITSLEGFKKAAKRYSGHHKKPTRNFQGETPYSPGATDCN